MTYNVFGGTLNLTQSINQSAFMLSSSVFSLYVEQGAVGTGSHYGVAMDGC